MEYVGLLAPIAFVFAISAYSQLAALRREIESLKVCLLYTSDWKCLHSGTGFSNWAALTCS